MSWTTTTLEELMFPADQWPDYITVGVDSDYSDTRRYSPDVVPDGTCHDANDIGPWRCSGCGCELDMEIGGEPTMWLNGMPALPRYCPYCGRRVKEEA